MATRKAKNTTKKNAMPASRAAKQAARSAENRKPPPRSAPAKSSGKNRVVSKTTAGRKAPVGAGKAAPESRYGARQQGPTAQRRVGAEAPRRTKPNNAAVAENARTVTGESQPLDVIAVSEGQTVPDLYGDEAVETEVTSDAGESDSGGVHEDTGADEYEAAFAGEADEAGEDSVPDDDASRDSVVASGSDTTEFDEVHAVSDADDTDLDSDETGPESEPPNSENRVRLSAQEPVEGGESTDEPVMVIAEDILGGDTDDEPADTGALLRSAIEALLFVAEKPVSIKDLAKGLQLDKKRTQELLEEVRVQYANRGIRIEEIADGYAFRTHPKVADYARAFLEQRPVKLSRAQLETLAIVAYRQPITRPEVDDIRGVDCGPVLKGLLERELVRILGKKDEPGRPMLYGTTPAFLELFGLKSLQELPTLREFAELSEDSRKKYEETMGEDAPPGLAQFGLEPEMDDAQGSEPMPASESLTLDGLLEAAETVEFAGSEVAGDAALGSEITGSESSEAHDREQRTRPDQLEGNEPGELGSSDDEEDDDEEDDDEEDDDEEDDDEDEQDRSS